MQPTSSLLTARVARVRAACGSVGVDALIVTHLPSIAYLTGFTGSAGVLVVTARTLCLVTDGRYRTALEGLAADGALPDGLQPRIARGAFEPEVERSLADARSARCGVEAAYLPVGHWSRLRHALSAAGNAAELTETEGIVESVRIVKDVWEVDVFREAGARLSAVLAGVLADLHEGPREVDVAQALEAGMRRTGFAKPAFDTIVASGPNSALPHARAGDRRLTRGDLVVIDFGGVFHGYSVDMTRTVAIGEPGEEARRLHQAVQDAQAAAIAAVRPTAAPEAIDAAARHVLEARGFGPLFVHGTGHGLGLEVHEAPRIAAAGTARAADAGEGCAVPAPVQVVPGMVFTIEPGAYRPGFGGVRIEDDVLVTLEGCEVLTTGDRTLRVC